MSKFKLAVLASIVIMVCATVVVAVDVYKAKQKLDYLYWVAENTHSGFVVDVIKDYEPLFAQKLLYLAGLCVATGVMAVAFLVLKLKKRNAFSVTL